MSILITVEEAASILNITKNRAYGLVREGHLPVVRLGRLVRIHREKLMAWIDQGGGNQPREVREPSDD